MKKRTTKGKVNMRIVWFIVLFILLILLIALFYKMGNELIEAFAFETGQSNIG